MGRNSLKKQESVGRTLAIYALWLALTALAAWAAWQAHATLIYVATLWLKSELPRPTGWTIATLSGISRISVLMIGALWLVGVLVMENALRHSSWRGHLVQRTLQIAIALFVILGACYSVIVVTSWIL